ncbi:MAG: hypothetical protein PWR22_1142 [Moorella sp. (in: firmicutes)]|uniref:prenylated flavin chaperone LpdD n=1 Tax=unclassified Neomoorella TaxID=2676739 RepID=UPI0010FFAC6E|nr:MULTISPECIES: hypothetical protein [unclassified Moorella (in: firmicutes)]MDK2816513.1 hypothetical protein [Moorella sp. (in: firmicutes)]MDK2894518.1 hypothetical protein [Moorella sp. (in: firmicutes)]GEA14567.1 hypothetical protein E308F_08090 [Moorella sp. E308F]GEA18062.1 hypothetical protein E306M_11980 [Moorella sp. E306M]
MRPLTYIAGRGRYRIFCRVFATREGYIAHLMGGTRPHVGAVALGLPRPSLKENCMSATTSVLTLLGHKDDELARPAAAKLAAGLNAPVVVVAGVHIDRAVPEELARLEANTRRAVEGIIKVWHRELQSRGPSK